MWQKLLLLALAGAAGTLARYGIGELVQRRTGSSFPFSTLAVNLAGCLLFGLIWSLSEERLLISAQARTILLVGFMGAFTTFSSFAFETGQFMRDGQWLLASANIAANNVLGIALFFLGHAAGKKF